MNQALKTNVLPSATSTFRSALYNAVGSVFGTHESEDDELRGQNVKGFLTAIAGKGSPKYGFFQRKMMFRTQDVSGRGTAAPDGSLGMDQIGLPEEMLWKMLDKLIVARLVRQGYGAVEARGLVDKRAPVAHSALLAETKERPFIFNRAPTLHRYSVVSAYAVPVQGKTIRVNPFAEKGLNLDYDGDTLQIHAPITPSAVSDAKNMMLSGMLLSDQRRDKLMAFPQHESILGISLASSKTANPDKKTRIFDSHNAVMAAYRKGEIQLTDPIEVKTEKHAEVDPIEDCSRNWSPEEALLAYPPDAIFEEFDADQRDPASEEGRNRNPTEEETARVLP